MSLIIFLLPALIASWIANYFIIKLAHKFKWFDRTDDRKIHNGNIPRIGGIGIILSFYLSLLVLFNFNKLLHIADIFAYDRYYMSFFISLLMIFMLGAIDDFMDLRAKFKLIVQITITLFIVLSGHYFVDFYIPFLNITVQSVPFGIFITFIWIIGITNAVNLIDGMDGLSSGIILIPILFLAIFFLISGYLMKAGVLLVLAGSIIGFMRYNFPPAKIFLGDGGSLFLGLLLAIIPLYFFQDQNYGGTLPIMAITIAIIPIYDTLSAIIRRKRQHRSILSPDKEHLHHKLLDFGLTTRQILILVYGLEIILSLSTVLYLIFLNKLIINVMILEILVVLNIIYFIRKLKNKKSIIKLLPISFINNSNK